MITSYLAIILGLLTIQQPVGPRKIFLQSSPSIATVTVKELDGKSSLASGFVVGSHRLITCWHVIANAESATVSFAERDSFPAKILTANPKADLALLSFGGDEPRLEIRTGYPLPGERLFAIGGTGLSSRMVDGEMAQTRNIDGVTVFQISNPVTHRYCGGPVIDEFGLVVGAVSIRLVGAPSHNFAVPSEYIKKLSATASEPMDFKSFRAKKNALPTP